MQRKIVRIVMWGKNNKIEFNFNQRVENSGILEAQKKINER